MTKSVALGIVLFVAGIAVGRVSVLMTQPSSTSPATPSAPAPSMAAAQPMMQGAPPAEAPANVLRGNVAEVIQVSQYTYLRLDSGEWAAVASAPGLTVGTAVTVLAQTQMTDFSSPSLGRTFPKIWFGMLEGAAPVARAAEPTGVMPAKAPPPPAVKDALQAVEASGALPLRVVDIYSERAVLAGQRVKVKGTVDRGSLVQGVYYLHLKDGTGAPADKSDDLLCLSTVELAKGAAVTLEGVVAVNKDVGMGPVPVVLDQAVVR
jgi:hypothetical protein